MAGRIEQRLTELGITLPTPAAPIANYVPFVVTGNLVVISGQIPRQRWMRASVFSACAGRFISFSTRGLAC